MDTKASLKELLQIYAKALDELERLQFIRTRNAPLGDAAEYLVLTALGGTLAPNSEKSYDLITNEGLTVQVKARAIDPSKTSSQTFSAIRKKRDENHKCDSYIFLLFDSSTYELKWARELKPDEVFSNSNFSKHVNAYTITTAKVAMLGKDITEIISASYK